MYACGSRARVIVCRSRILRHFHRCVDHRSTLPATTFVAAAPPETNRPRGCRRDIHLARFSPATRCQFLVHQPITTVSLQVDCRQQVLGQHHQHTLVIAGVSAHNRCRKYRGLVETVVAIMQQHTPGNGGLISGQPLRRSARYCRHRACDNGAACVTAYSDPQVSIERQEQRIGIAGCAAAESRRSGSPSSMSPALPASSGGTCPIVLLIDPMFCTGRLDHIIAFDRVDALGPQLNQRVPLLRSRSCRHRLIAENARRRKCRPDAPVIGVGYQRMQDEAGTARIQSGTCVRCCSPSMCDRLLPPSAGKTGPPATPA